MTDGVLVVNKPVGPTSHDVVVVARRSLGIRRIGHTGTLDPLASGVLPLVLGQATRLAQHFTASDKEYEATIRFGVTSDTYDAAGQIVEHASIPPAPAELERALDRFRGTFPQTPPAYSAKMVGGHRAYTRARAGNPVHSPAMPVTVHGLDLIEYTPPTARLRVRCSAGFYVRSLAHDLGQVLATGALLDALTRTEAAGFRLDDAIGFEALATAPRSELRRLVRPMHALLAEMPTVGVTAEGVDWARHGRDLGPPQLTSPLDADVTVVRMVGPDGTFVGLADCQKTPGLLHPAVVFRYN